MTRNGVQSSPGRFLNENDVEIGIDLEDRIDDEIVFLRKKFQVFQNHRLLVFIAE